MSKRRDAISVGTSRAVLEALGCPDVRLGEGSDEWKGSRGSYPFTPDLVAGPLVGGGDRSDFYIDVFAPTGDQYVKPRAGNPLAALTLVRAVAENGTLNLTDFADTGEQLVKPMNDKLAKYVGSRANTPMFGLAMYFRMTGNQYVGPVIAALQALNTLDGAFGITAHLGHEAKDRVMRALLSPGQSSFVLTLPIEQPLSFVLYTAEKADGVRVVMLVNHAITRQDHPHAGHPVITWLRGMTTADAAAIAEGRACYGRPAAGDAEPPPAAPRITIGFGRGSPV
jgi:hypothetical protein